ncbi:MAG: hypothetical protein PHU06_11805 [Gallionella sp.]|nr:hypothetical protein [Gallionella sp.]
MSIFAIYGFVTLGIGAAIIDFFRTPKETRYRIPRPPSLEEQLKTLPESAQAIILRANKKRSLAKLMHLIIIGVVFVGFSTWLENTNHPECVRIFGLNVAYIALLFVCYGGPIAVFIWSIICIPEGIIPIAYKNSNNITLNIRGRSWHEKRVEQISWKRQNNC